MVRDLISPPANLARPLSVCALVGLTTVGLLLGGCITTGPADYGPQGPAQVMLPGVTRDQVLSMLVESHANIGVPIQRLSPYHAAFEAPMSSLRAFSLGYNRYAAKAVMLRAQYTLSDLPDGVLVQGIIGTAYGLTFTPLMSGAEVRELHRIVASFPAQMAILRQR
jgi:hypothetical protein